MKKGTYLANKLPAGNQGSLFGNQVQLYPPLIFQTSSREFRQVMNIDEKEREALEQAKQLIEQVRVRIKKGRNIESYL